MSESIITAESLKTEAQAQEESKQHDNADSPDETKDENLETIEAEENADESENVEAETPDADTEDAEKADAHIDSDESEEGTEDVAEESAKPDMPKWAEKRLLRERRKHEREMNELRQQQTAPPPVQYDTNTQVQNPFTGQVVDINSVEGQVALQLTQAAQAQAQFEQQQKQQETQTELKQKLEKGYAKFDDFEEMVVGAGITEAMLVAANKTKSPDELLYNLAKYKPDEIDRISKLTPEDQLYEMGRLSEQMKQSTKKKIVKKVPEPPSKIKGSGASVKDESDLSFEDILKRRRQAERERLK